MNYKKIIAVAALVIAASTCIAMEEIKYPIRSHSGQIDAPDHAFLMNLISNSTLEKACADIRTLAHTNEYYYQLLNTPYNTRVLIKELAQRYTNNDVAKAARELNTGAVLPILCEKTLTIAPQISEKQLNRAENYFSLLPTEIRNLVISTCQRGQTKKEILKTTQDYIQRNIIPNNFNTIEEFASILDGYETNRKAALLAAAQLLDTKKSKLWIELIKPSESEKVAANFIRGKLYIKELKNQEEGLRLLEYTAVQYDNKPVRQEAQDFLYSLDQLKYKKYAPEKTVPEYFCKTCKFSTNKQHLHSLGWDYW